MITYSKLLHAAVREYGFSTQQLRSLLTQYPGKDAGDGLSADYAELYNKIIAGEIKPL